MTAQRGDFGRLPFASASRSSRPFEARFPGICEECQSGFEAGEQVRYEDDELVHADPDDCVAITRSTEVPCKRCFLTHAGDGF